jgi:hypothetical protein
LLTNTRRAAAITVAAAPVFSILRLIGSTIGVLLTFGCPTYEAHPRHPS